MRRRTLAVGAAAALVALTAAAAQPPRDAHEGERRFEVVEVGDSTVTVLTRGNRWLRPGAYGIAVDPRQRDALVARLRLLSRRGDSSVALVTGQTTRLTTDYVAIFRRPPVAVLRRGSFWGGAVTGLLVGAAAVLLLVRRR